MPAKQEIVRGHHPVMLFLEEQLTAQKVPAYKAAKKAGLSINVISSWRRGMSPSVGNLDAVLNVLGYRLAVVPLQQPGPISGGSVEA